MTERAAKQPRLDPDVAANVIIQFESAEGEHAGWQGWSRHSLAQGVRNTAFPRAGSLSCSYPVQNSH
jgi:hypothetical protein